MPQTRTVSFRDQTTGQINDLMEDEHKACARSQNMLAYLAGALINYRDEGVEFAPIILFCDSIQDILKAFPGSISHIVGRAELTPSSGSKILKDCAPLSGRSWFVFIQRTDSVNAIYGVFTYLQLPTAITLQDGIQIDPGNFCIMIHKSSSNTIEMRGAKGSVLTLIFSTLRDVPVTENLIGQFAVDCCSEIDKGELSKTFHRYFSRLLEVSLAASHGTILVCTPDCSKLVCLPEIQDAVEVSPALDFKSAFSDYHTSASADAILGLQRCEELLNGFLRCDGMIFFDTQGGIKAYRVFYRGVSQVSTPTTVVSGGARRRAFEGLKAVACNNVKSILFRSQDGQTLYHRGVK